MSRSPIFTDAEIISARDSLISPGREVEPWDVFVALGQRGKFSRVQKILEANPPSRDDETVPKPKPAFAQMPDDIRSEIGQIGADFATRATEVVTAAVDAAKREHEAHEAALREAHQAQMHNAACEIQRVEARAAQQAEMICALETTIDSLETTCADRDAEIAALRAERERLAAEVSRLSDDRDTLADERDTALSDLAAVTAERDRLDGENTRLAAELDRIVGTPGCSDPPSPALPEEDGARASKPRAAGKQAGTKPRKRPTASDSSKAQGGSGTSEEVSGHAGDGDPWRDPSEPPFPGFADHDADQRQERG